MKQDKYHSMVATGLPGVKMPDFRVASEQLDKYDALDARFMATSMKVPFEESCNMMREFGVLRIETLKCLCAAMVLAGWALPSNRPPLLATARLLIAAWKLQKGISP